MVYEWGRSARSEVDANQVGQQIEEIAQRDGVATPRAILDAARPKRSVMHPLFEWDDGEAAEAYRRHQARQVANSLVVVYENEQDEEERVPAFYNVSLLEPTNGDAERKRGYQSIAMVKASPESAASARDELFAILEGLQRRFDALGEFEDVWHAVEVVKEKVANGG